MEEKHPSRYIHQRSWVKKLCRFAEASDVPGLWQGDHVLHLLGPGLQADAPGPPGGVLGGPSKGSKVFITESTTGLLGFVVAKGP